MFHLMEFFVLCFQVEAEAGKTLRVHTSEQGSLWWRGRRGGRHVRWLCPNLIGQPLVVLAAEAGPALLEVEEEASEVKPLVLMIFLLSIFSRNFLETTGHNHQIPSVVFFFFPHKPGLYCIGNISVKTSLKMSFVDCVTGGDAALTDEVTADGQNGVSFVHPMGEIFLQPLAGQTPSEPQLHRIINYQHVVDHLHQ